MPQSSQFPVQYNDISWNYKLRLYAGANRDYLIHDAIASDTTPNFVSNPEPKKNDTITITVRTARDNARAVDFHTENETLPMKKTARDKLFDYYCVDYRITRELSYYFSVSHQKASTCFYNAYGISKEVLPEYNFRIIPDFKTPDWAKGACMYQIYVDRFYNGDKTNDVVNNEYAYMSRAAKRIENWNQSVATDDICNFYGGDLRGVMEKLDYIKDLGAQCIYFTPLFVSPSNHKYDIQDYDYIDPHIGAIVKDGGDPLYFEKFHNRYATKYIQRTTSKENLEASNKLFCELVEAAHKRGIRVILDGVFNHCGAFNKWLDREGFYAGKDYPPGAYRERKSPYNKYFKWYDDDWPNNDCYDGWWGHENHPKLNYEGSRELYNYVLDIGRKWVSPPYNADGWRLDVAADLGSSPEFNHKFWKDFRKAVKKANPNAIILAEHYGEATDWLKGDEWDTVMNYDAFMEPLTWFLTGMEKHSESYREDLLCNAMAFEDAMRYHMSRFTYQSLYVAMNELSNHDHSRFLTRTNMKVGRLHTIGARDADIGINMNIMFEAVTFQMTWPGAPTVYYGDEAGLTGWTDPDNRRPYPWGREDKTLINFHKEMINLRKTYEALKNGSVMFLYTNYGVISYARWDKNTTIIVMLNNNKTPKTIYAPVWKAGIINGKLKKLIYAGNDTFSTEEALFDAKNGMLKITLPEYSSIVLAGEGRGL